MDVAARDLASPPRWIRDGLRATFGELKAFVQAGYQFSRHPSRFARSWSNGDTKVLNPAAMMATAAGFTLALRALLASVHGLEAFGGTDGLLGQIIDAVGPHVHYALLGLVAHGVLSVGGSRRPLGSTIGVALFVGSGPALLAQIASFVDIAVFLRFGPAAHVTSAGSAWGATTLLVVLLGWLLMLVTLAAGLSGVHGRPRWVTAVAVLVAVVVVGHLFHVMPQRFGAYGPHLALWWRGGIPGFFLTP
jgi:hypothetical protein